MMKNKGWWALPGILLILSCGQTSGSVEKQDTAKVEKVSELPTDTVKLHRKRIVFFGNSLTAGYGLTPDEAFPHWVQKKIDSLQLPYTVVNAGLSGETTSGGLARIDWILQQPVDVFILELGGNDGLRGIPLDLTAQNLQKILDHVKQKYPSVKMVMAGMQIPPNLGTEYTSRFRAIFKDLASKNGIILIPFRWRAWAGTPN
jgi:acyl-CoA thioesterase-1